MFKPHPKTVKYTTRSECSTNVICPICKNNDCDAWRLNVLSFHEIDIGKCAPYEWYICYTCHSQFDDNGNIITVKRSQYLTMENI